MRRDRLGVKLPKALQCGAGMKQAGIKKIRALTSRLQRELTKTQHLMGERKLDEFSSVATSGVASFASCVYTLGLKFAMLMARTVLAKLISAIRGTGLFPGRTLVIIVENRLFMRIITLNCNGIRAAHRKGLFSWLSRQRADLMCVQETKAQRTQLLDAIAAPRGWHTYFMDAEKRGYSGVAIYSRHEPDEVSYGLGAERFDREGRYVEARFGKLRVASVYFPSGSSSDERQQVKFDFLDYYMPILKRRRKQAHEYLLCGDWNIAHKKIDLKNWRSNQKNSGFLPQERQWMDELFDAAGYVDAFRTINSEPEQYTWWSNRGQAWANNVGWRLDYQVVTPGLAPAITAASIYKRKRFSDHAPLVMDYAVDIRDF